MWGFTVRGSWRPNRIAIYWPPLLWPSVLHLSRSPGLLNRRPRGPHCWVMAFFTASYQQLLWTPTHRGPWKIAIYWPPLLWPSALCLSRSPGLLNRKPRGPLCWVMAFFTASYQQLLWTPTHQGPWGPLWSGVAFPTPSYQQLIFNSNSNCLTSVLTELYNSSTPTQSLEWHVWSSSSGNNCHAVHRSLSSGASLWSGTFTLSHIISRAHLRDFLS